jgi:predicted SPOUT superfamily RNA methylase MTH1
MNSVEQVLVTFGSLRTGLAGVLSQEGWNSTDPFHCLVSPVSMRKVATVRTEEALFMTSGILNAMSLK